MVDYVQGDWMIETYSTIGQTLRLVNNDKFLWKNASTELALPVIL